MQDDRQIIVSPSLIHAPKVVAMPYGMTIRQIVDRANPAGEVVVEVNGAVVPEDRWDYTPPDKAHVMISVPMHGGGKSPFRIILMIAVMAAAFYVGGGNMAIGAFFKEGSMSAMFAGVGVMTAGSLLVNAIAPVRVDSQKKSTEDSNTYSISGAQNKSNPWGTVPVVLGRHRMYPPFGADPYTEIADGDEYLNLLLIWGYSAITVEDLKIGDTNLSEFLGVEFQITDDHTTDPITMFPSTVHQESIGIELLEENDPTVQAATPNVDRLSVDLVFPNGLAIISDSGARTKTTVKALIQYRELPSGSWVTVPTTSWLYVSGTRLEHSTTPGTHSIYASNPGAEISQALGTGAIEGCYRIGEYVVDALGTLDSVTNLNPAGTTGFELSIIPRCGLRSPRIGVAYGTAGTVETTLPTFTEKKTEAVRRSFTWDVDRTKSYEVAVSRVTADVDDYQTVDAMFWTNLRSIKNDDPMANFKKPLTAMALRIKATDQLNGVIDDLNGIVTSRVNVWNTGTESWWTDDWTPTSNPAALFLSVLMHNANARPRTSSQIDLDALGTWYEFCDTNGYEFNQIRDFQAGIWDTLSDIAAAGRASPTLMEGLWSVVCDTGDQAVVHHITQRNSWGFSAEKILFNPPHAFRVKFVNEDNGFKDDERIVYDDGYTSANATLFEQIEFPGITSPDLVWKFGRFHIAQARLRPETYSVYQDFEHLICKRGDKVRVSHDVPLWGVGAGRVKSLILNEAETHIAKIVLDEKIAMESGKTYCCRFRRHSDDVLLTITTEVGETATLTLATEVLIANGPEVGDLAMFGETDNETVELLVQSVVRSSDFTAQIFMVDAAPAIYTADTGTIPDFDPHITKPIDVTRFAPDPPVVVSVITGDIALDFLNPTVTRVQIIICLTSASNRVPVGMFEVRYRIYDVTLDENRSWFFASATVDSGAVHCMEVIAGFTYEWQARAISVWGVPSAWTTLTTNLAADKTWSPSDTESFTAELSGMNVILTWAPVVGAVNYDIRVGGTGWDDATPVAIRTDSPYMFPAPTTPATYTYRIRSIDMAGNYSDTEISDDLIIEGPSTPTVTAIQIGNWAIVSWQDCTGSFPIDYYTVNTVTQGPGLRFTDCLEIGGPASIDYDVIAVDMAGNLSIEGSDTLVVDEEEIGSADGVSSALVAVYKRAATTPAAPTRTATYTFSTGAFAWGTGTDDGWTYAMPAVDGNPLWISTAVAVATAPIDTDTIDVDDWSTPIQLAGDGADGADGYNQATLYLYQRSASTPSPAYPGSTMTYTFATGGLTGTLGSWSRTIPTGTNPLYVIAASAISTEATDTIAQGEWSSPVIMAQNGLDGIQAATVFMYKRATAQPSQPTTTGTYTFATAVITGVTGWTQGIPDPLAGYYIWVIAAAAIADATSPTASIDAGDWSTATELALNGTDGTDGYNHATLYLYQRYATQPSGPSSTMTYTFSTKTLAGTFGNWKKDIDDLTGTNPIWIIAACASSTSDTDSISAAEWTTPIILAQNGADGADGAAGEAGEVGPGLVYRGTYASGTYYCTATRRDVVKGSDSQYYICKLTHSYSSSYAPITGGSWSTSWEAFATTFESVCTKLLLAEDAAIVYSLHVGGGAGDNTVGLTGTGTGSTAVRIWAGSATKTSAPFRVTQDGHLYATAASITGVIDAAYMHGCTLYTKGGYLTASCSAGASTISVSSTADFPSSGKGFFVDSTTDQDEFTYTGKTTTTLTGCSGLLAHSISSTKRVIVLPGVSCMVLSDLQNELRYYGNRGDGTISQLVKIGEIYDPGTSLATCISAGSLSCTRIGIIGSSDTNYGIYGSSNHIGVMGYSLSSYGVWGKTSSGIAIYGEGAAYFTGNVSADSFTDRTPSYEGDALSELRLIQGKDGNIDHATLPTFMQKTFLEASPVIDKKTGEKCKDSAGNIKTKPTPAVGRDIGAAVSMLIVAVQQIADRLDALEIVKRKEI